jgi:glutamate carboxypeptidase
MLTDLERTISAHVDDHLEEGFALLERAVRIPSATGNFEGVRAVGRLFSAELDRLGFSTEWVIPDGVETAGHLIGRRAGTRGRRLLLIGHLDTVLESDRFERDGAYFHGIGASDMKGGDVVILQALAALQGAGALEETSISVILTGDEEQPPRPFEKSRSPLFALAGSSDVALAFECAYGETATIARRGVTTWRVDVSAMSGHSSLIFSEPIGSGAILEAARILDRFRRELTEEYLTFNPSLVAGGVELEADLTEGVATVRAKTNVVPQTATLAGDLRFISEEQRVRVRAAMERIVSESLPQTRSAISFAEGFPALFPSAANRALFEVLDQTSRDLELGPLEILDPSRRGAGDVSFVGERIAALDGLGPKGEGEHAADERALIDSFAPQIKRAAVLIHRLTRD